MLPERVAKLLGKSGDTRIMEVEKGAIKRYADAVGETNLLYWDDDHARKSKYGSIISPPGFFGWPSKWEGMPIFDALQNELMQVLTEEGFGRIVAGGSDQDFFRPIRAGDILSATPKVISVTEKESKSGTMYVGTIETTYINQNGDIVAKDRKSFIAR